MEVAKLPSGGRGTITAKPSSREDAAGYVVSRASPGDDERSRFRDQSRHHQGRDRQRQCRTRRESARSLPFLSADTQVKVRRSQQRHIAGANVRVAGASTAVGPPTRYPFVRAVTCRTGWKTDAFTQSRRSCRALRLRSGGGPDPAGGSAGSGVVLQSGPRCSGSAARPGGGPSPALSPSGRVEGRFLDRRGRSLRPSLCPGAAIEGRGGCRGGLGCGSSTKQFGIRWN